MRLYFQILLKKLEQSEQHSLNKKYLKSIWEFYSVFQMARKYLGIKDKKDNLRNKLWKKILINPEDTKTMNKIKLLMKDDFGIISIALRKIQGEIDKEGIEYGLLYKEGMIGVLNFEYPD